MLGDRDVVVLCGGRGTRLRGVTGGRQKTLAEVAGRPFLEWLLLALRRQGVGSVLLATGHEAGEVESRLGDGRRLGVEVRYSREPAPLGTGGALRLALQATSAARLLVLNGDSYCRMDLRALAGLHAGRGARASLVLANVPDRRRYGAVDCAPDGAVTAYLEKLAAGPGAVNAGVGLYEREVLAAIPEGIPVSLERAVLPALVGRGLYGLLAGGPLVDIGTPEDYQAAGALLAGDLRQLAAHGA